MIRLKAFEGSVQMFLGRIVEAFLALGGEKEFFAVMLQPRPNALFGFKITRGGVDMIDPLFEKLVEDLVGVLLG
jgi:hypothetical protein